MRYLFLCYVLLSTLDLSVEVRQTSDINRMLETEVVIPAETGDAKQGNDLYVKPSFITKIDVTAGGAVNEHISGLANGEVITNGEASAEIKLSNGNDSVTEETTNEVTVDKDVTTNDIVETLSEELTTNEIKGTEELTTNEIKGKKESENQTDEDKNVEVTIAGTTNMVETNLEEIVLTPSGEIQRQPLTSNDDEAKKMTELEIPELSVEGSDEVAPATSFFTTDRDGAVKLRMGTKEYQAEKPITVISVFKKTVERVPNNLALAVKRGGSWVKWTFKQYYADVIAAAKSFIKLGLEPHHGVGILGFNSPEWFISDIGAIFAGGFATGIYATNTPEAVEYVAKHSEANVLVVENNQQLQKVLQIWDNLPALKAVVQYTGEVAERRNGVYSWEEFMKVGQDVSDDQLQQRIDAQSPNKCCTLIYTSGTTGEPKAVMLSHDNLMWTTNTVMKQMGFKFGSEILVSYLPLSHVAAQLLDIHGPITLASAVYFAEPDALKGSLLGTLREVRPTIFFGVPRVWEKFYEGIRAQAKNSGALKRKIATWAKGVGHKGSMAMMNKLSTPFGWGIANALVFKKARVALGFDRCHYFLSGAAPIMKETLDFFYSINITLHEVYGMSENTGPHTVGFPDAFRIGTVGKCFVGAEIKLANVDEEGNGEICISGRHVFMGYLNAPEKTKETFDDDDWLCTGDIGKHDDAGFLTITGRIKEIIITAGGENIAPVPIENNVKVALPCISNCMAIGDKRKFMSMILCLKVDIDPNTGEPTGNLTQEARDWCQSIGSTSTTVVDVIEKKDAIVLKGIQNGIDKANEKSVSRAAKIQKWSIIPKDFSIPGGELGPTLKLKRPVVVKMYKKTLDAFYGNDGEAK